MRLLGVSLTALAVMAAAQAVAAALWLLLLLAALYGLFAHPRATLGLIGLGVLAGLIERHPLACIGLAALLTVAKLIAGTKPLDDSERDS